MDPQRVSHLLTAIPALSGAAADASGADPRKPSKKKPYRRPRLTLWGDLRDVTLGPSPGVGESGQPGMFKA